MKPVLALLAAAVAGAGGAGCGGEPGAAPGERRTALWSEFLDDAAVRAALPFLAGERADLYLALPRARIGDPALAALLREAVAADVGVRAWLLVDRADGYWPTEGNAPAVRAAVMAFADWRDAEALPVDWVIFDMEMSLQRTEEVAAVTAAMGSLAGLAKIKEGRDPAAFAAHRQEYDALVRDVQARGLKVMCVTYPTVLDDGVDGDDDIQDEMDVPVVGLPWDEASFMVYQSLIADLSGSWHGADVVLSYGQTARELFPGRAALALGIVGSAGITPVTNPYPDAPTLAADVSAARAAGLERVSLYSLDGILEQPAPGDWVDDALGPVTPPPVDAEQLRGLIRGLLD